MKRQNEKKTVGELLIERGFVTPAVVEQLLGLQSDSNERLASLAVRWKHVTEVQALEALSEQKGVPGLDLHQVVIPLETLSCVPLKIAEEYGILPVEIREGQLFLAMTDPSDRRVVDEIEFATGFRVFPYVCLHATLHRYVHEAYKSQREGETQHVGTSVPLEDSVADGSKSEHANDEVPGLVLEISEQPSSGSVSARFSLPPTRTSNGSSVPTDAQ